MFQYGAAARDVTLRLKYGKVTWVGGVLGHAMRGIAAEMTRPDVVIPVPLHPARLRGRGFNQSALLAGPLAKAMGCPMNTAALRRIRDTTPQAGLSKQDRKENIRGAFVVSGKRSLSGMRVMLVDDVITTGMTAREAALALLNAGACSVEVIAFARAC